MTADRIEALEAEVAVRNTLILDLQRELGEYRRLQTLGGPPPACRPWRNVTLPGGVHEDYRGRL